MKKQTVLIRTVMQPHTAGFKRDDVRKQKHLSKNSSVLLTGSALHRSQ